MRAGSLTRAASSLGYTQSAISRMIVDVERELGCTLIRRSRQGVAPTSDFEELRPDIERLCLAFTKLEDRAQELSGLELGKIRVGAFSSVATHWLPPAIARFKELHPHIEYEVLMGDYAEIEAWVESGRVDFGFLPRAPHVRSISFEPLAHDSYTAVLMRESPLCNRGPVTLEDLACEPFILLEKGGESEVARLFETEGVALTALLSTWDDYAIMAMVEEGLGNAILPEIILRRLAYKVTLSDLSPAYGRDICVIKRHDGSLSKVAYTFIEEVRSYAERDESSL